MSEPSVAWQEARADCTAQWCRLEFAPGVVERWRSNPPSVENALAEGALVSKGDWDEQKLQSVWRRGYSYKQQNGNQKLHLLAKVGHTYDVFQDYERAKSKLLANVTPHGFFWELPEGNLHAAAKFSRSFGPLTGELGEILNHEFCWIDVQDFWRKQRRFQLITKLWLTCDDPIQLRSSWPEVHEDFAEIKSAEPFPLGVGIRGLPWEQSPFCGNFLSWIQRVPANELRRQTALFVQFEINSHLSKHRPVWHTPFPLSAQRPQYKMQIERYDSLWNELWYMFALDTANPPAWRLCPHCGILFYPPRKDRKFCSSEIQTLYSKGKWWNENKSEQLRKRKKNRVRRKPSKAIGPRKVRRH